VDREGDVNRDMKMDGDRDRIGKVTYAGTGIRIGVVSYTGRGKGGRIGTGKETWIWTVGTWTG
jgi:hypothetical protein